jgi:4-diphosphocytidyl-2-C-methyl-D-erythritol kinase
MLVSERAHAKINLALHIIGRRADGYHELESVVAFADVADVLTISPAALVSLDITGPFGSGLPRDERNSVIAAWRQLDIFSRQKGVAIAPVKFHLEKNLPVAAGIGGGSADAAAALRGLIRLFGISVSAQDMKEIALELGADVPICLGQKASRMRGIGEIIEPIAVSLPRAVLLVNPRVPLPTLRVFEALNLQCGQSFGTAIGDLTEIRSWRNDLTAPAIRIVPEIASVLESLESQEDITCSRMSGSGATCFGLVENLGQAEHAATNIKNQHPDWWVVATNLL